MFDTKKIEPQYAFGYGLSYADFKISDVKINKKKYTKKDKIKVTFNVANNSNREGAEVVQIYIGKEKSKVKRALKELKGFKKVYLEKSTNKNASISINTKELGYYNTDISDWVIEEGKYTLYIGNASNNITKKIIFKID